MHSIEEQICLLLPALENLSHDDGGAVAFARAAAHNLRHLVATGVFGALTGPSLALVQAIASDQDLRSADRAVAKVLLAALDPERGDARLSQPAICQRAGLSRSTVLRSIRRLAEAGYFVVIEPSREELFNGDHARRYRPQFVG